MQTSLAGPPALHPGGSTTAASAEADGAVPDAPPAAPVLSLHFCAREQHKPCRGMVYNFVDGHPDARLCECHCHAGQSASQRKRSKW